MPRHDCWIRTSVRISCVRRIGSGVDRIELRVRRHSTLCDSVRIRLHGLTIWTDRNERRGVKVGRVKAFCENVSLVICRAFSKNANVVDMHTCCGILLLGVTW